MAINSPAWLAESRTRAYSREQARIAASNAEIADLEAQVFESESRNQRLTRDLMRETKLRAQVERQRSDGKEAIKKLQAQLAEAEAKINELSGPTKRTPAKDRPKKSTRRSSAKLAADTSGGKSRKRAALPNPSARKRGNVK